MSSIGQKSISGLNGMTTTKDYNITKESLHNQFLRMLQTRDFKTFNIDEIPKVEK